MLQQKPYVVYIDIIINCDGYLVDLSVAQYRAMEWMFFTEIEAYVILCHFWLALKTHE